ncbi:MAG: beta-ketoacyl synthase chain length factor [Thioalkalispiraceae bacterium]
MEASFTLDTWSAHLADREGDEQCLLSTEQVLDVSFLPPLKRRRLSKLSRMSLRLAHTVAPDYQGYCVFGSQHGELVTTQGLLESIIQGEIVSPAGFSASVHNTAVGLHSINCKNTYPCTSIAAGIDTLAMCFIESFAILNSGEANQVLLVCADDVVPDELAEFVPGNSAQGFAALVKPATADADNIIQLSRVVPGAVDTNERLISERQNAAIESLVSLLKSNRQRSVEMPGECGKWRWQQNV